MLNRTTARSPSAYETERVSRCIEVANRKAMRHARTSKNLCISIGLMLMAMVAAYPHQALILILWGTLFFVFAFMCVYSKRTLSHELRMAGQGDFDVVDGYISRLEYEDSPYPSLNAWFTSADGTVTDGPYRVLQQGANQGEPLIFVNIRVSDKKHRSYVFTPFMLTEEGIKLHW